MVLHAGDFLGRYEILGPLGAGGMGEVYRARDTTLDRQVAIKVLPEAVADNPDRLARFEREARAVARLSHPSILDIHDFGREEKVTFAVTELLEGESLRERLASGPLGWREAVAMGAEVADGLAAAHRAGIVHRDLKPANLFHTTDGRVKILDFGLAKRIESRDGQPALSEPPTEEILTGVGTVVGTTGYMAPEQLRGREADGRSDIFSLGCVLYELVSGRRAFGGDSAVDTMAAILTQEPPSLADSGATIPEDFQRIVQRCLEKRPELRFQEASDLAFDLRALLSGSHPRSSSSVPVLRPTAPWRRRAVVGAAAAVAVVTAVLAWLSVRPTLAFSHQDRVLVADVENLTGEPVFDLALRTAIEADLQQSSFAIVFDRGQVGETLRLMRRDPSTPVDEELGCDVCRFAGVRALVVPRIAVAGDAYDLQAILVDPVRRRHVDRIRVAALGREEVLLESVDELARQVRSRLGESIESIERTDLPTVQLTTSSWEALHHLTRAQTAWMRGDYREAAAVFEMALEEDPEFATARASLGLTMIQFLGEPERGAAEMRRALADAEYLPRRERLLIRAATLQYAEANLEGALAEYRVLLKLYPDCAEAVNNSGMILRDLGRLDESVTMYEKAADLAPTSTIPLANLYFTHMFFRFDPVAAEGAARRLVDLAPHVAHFQNSMAWCLVAQGRLEEAVEPLQAALAIEPHHPYAFPNLAHVLLALGRADEAVPVYREYREAVVAGELSADLDKCTFDLAYAAARAGDPEMATAIAGEGRDAILTRLGGQPPSAGDRLLLGQLAAAAGDDREARVQLDSALAAGVGGPDEMVLLAELYALLGDRDRAIENLLHALDSGYGDRFFPRVLPALQPVRDDPRFVQLYATDAG